MASFLERRRRQRRLPAGGSRLRRGRRKEDRGALLAVRDAAVAGDSGGQKRGGGADAEGCRGFLREFELDGLGVGGAAQDGLVGLREIKRQALRLRRNEARRRMADGDRRRSGEVSGRG